MSEPRNCGDCGATSGQLHTRGCDVERCPLCGGQAIGCACIYEVCGINYDQLENLHPDIYKNGPTEEMEKRFEEELAKYGGRLPWTGEWPEAGVCRELGLFCLWSDEHGWQACGKDHPEATEDLNRLHLSARWDKTARKWVPIRPRKTPEELASAPVGSVVAVEVLDQLKHVNDVGLPDGFRIWVNSLGKKAVLMTAEKFARANIPLPKVDYAHRFPTLSGKNRWSIV